MQLMGILIELRGEGAASAGIYRHTWRSRARSIFVPHVPCKVTGTGAGLPWVAAVGRRWRAAWERGKQKTQTEFSIVF